MRNTLLTTLIILLTTLTPLTSLHAQEDDSEDRDVVVAPMKIDCSTLTKEQLDDAVRLEICPEIDDGSIQPFVKVYGDCGWAQLIIDDSVTVSGKAFFRTTLNSTAGPMVGGSLVINWSGASASGSFSPGAPFFQTYWSSSVSRITGSGPATGTLSGWVGIANTTLSCGVGPVTANFNIN